MASQSSKFIDRFKGKTSTISKEGLLSSLAKSPSSNSYVLKETPLSESRFVDANRSESSRNSNYLSNNNNSNTNQASSKKFFAQNGASILDRSNNLPPSNSSSHYSFLNSESTKKILADYNSDTSSTHSRDQRAQYLNNYKESLSLTPQIAQRYITEASSKISSKTSSNRTSNIGQFNNNNNQNSFNAQHSLIEANRTIESQKQSPLLYQHKQQQQHLQSKKKLEGIVEQWMQEQTMLFDSLNQTPITPVEIPKKTGSSYSAPGGFQLHTSSSSQKKNLYSLENNTAISRQSLAKYVNPQALQLQQPLHNPYTLESLRNLDKEKPSRGSGALSDDSTSKIRNPNQLKNQSIMNGQEEKEAKSYLNSYAPSFAYVNDNANNVGQVGATPMSMKKQNSSRMLFQEYMSSLDLTNNTKNSQSKAKLVQYPYVQQQTMSVTTNRKPSNQIVNQQSTRSTKGNLNMMKLEGMIISDDTVNSKSSHKSRSHPMFSSSETTPVNKLNGNRNPHIIENQRDLEESHLGFLNRIQSLHTNNS